jgi:hypothetical protein
MENKKYETLIDLIINENEEKARELFHEIVVEKSREIYESIMADEMAHEESMEEGDMVGSMLDEIEVDETMSEDDSDAEEVDHEAEKAGDELTHDLEDSSDEDSDMDIEDKVDDLEDRIVDAENEIDALIKKFEAELGGSDMGGEEEVEVDAEEVAESADEEEMEEDVMEAVQLQKVSVTHGDDGANKKSVVAANSGKSGMQGAPVKFSGDSEAVPTSPKAPSNEYTKKEGELPGAGKFKNVPGGKAKVDLEKAPAPVKKDGASGTKSPVAK